MGVLIPLLMFSVGAVTISVGAGMIYRPAGLIVAGLFLVLLSVKLVSGQSSK